MFKLYGSIENDDVIEFEGQSYDMDMSFDNVLHVIDILSDTEEDDLFKIQITICLLLDWGMDDLEHYPFDVQWQLFEQLMDHLNMVGGDADDAEGAGQQVMDYTQDAEAIYASFFYAYKLDLFEEQGRLHYKKFVALLQHLHKDTAFKEIVGYRTMKIPTEKEASKDYIKHLRKMKRLYKLKSKDTDTASEAEARDERLSAIGARFKSKKRREDT
ncbi:bacteriophage Gp15 family protein [Salinicoccus roseus]|uniref:Gp15 family bacteriophage protein n=1 Tax=Salinicoccus roseus TaxID=45670 RepID=UPI001CA74CA3|nr:Gp15 family bacteriophage protein [Salinicoccus roseus]MBY8908212.1 bacteriophage Gp15 family protein [Salinicoccus roseus]